MVLFEPWIGNSNPTAQNKNDYIRRLKDALADVNVTGIESGTYTGDGSATQQIVLTNSDLTPSFIFISSLDKGSGDMHVNFATDAMSGDSFRIRSAAGTPAIVASSITSFAQGSFTVGGTGVVDLNTNIANFGYIVLGIIT